MLLIYLDVPSRLLTCCTRVYKQEQWGSRKGRLNTAAAGVQAIRTQMSTAGGGSLACAVLREVDGNGEDADP